jgi:F420-0:gamma-glutamyl ligase-like protein
MRYIKQALIETAKLPLDISKTITTIDQRLYKINQQLNGDATLARREFETAPSVNGRIGYIIGSLWSTTAAPTQTQISGYEIAAKAFTPIYMELKATGEEVKKLEDLLEKSGAPATPGRLPEWKGN